MKGITGKMQIVVLDSLGNPVSKREIQCHSFVKAFAELVWVLLFMQGDTEHSAYSVRIGGVSGQFKAPNSGISPLAVSINDAYKLQCRIGTNTKSFHRMDYDVITYLDQMSYSQYTINDDGTQLTLTMSFSWLNTTGSSKDITEAALAAVYVNGIDSYSRWWGISRDVFSAVTVPNGYTLAVGYVITLPW